MYQIRRPRLSAAERSELWARWKQGDRLSDIAAALGRAPGTVYARIRKAGGIPERPRAGADLPGTSRGAGGARRPGGLAARCAPQALQAGAAAPPVLVGGGEARSALVPTADCGLAAACQPTLEVPHFADM
jgi:hypothetical protein